jgi:hypothetical protein
LAALFFGDRTWVAAFVREAARVARVVVVVGAAGFWTGAGAALTRFFGAGSSAFSLSSEDISSLLRFLARVVLVAFAYAGVGLLVLADLGRSSVADAGAAAEEVAMAFVGAAVRVLRAAGGFVVAFLAAVAVFAMGAGAGAGAGFVVAGAAAFRSSRTVVCRVTLGMRLTRRSKRDCIEAACALHCARSFSMRASISSRRFWIMFSFASAVRACGMLLMMAGGAM